MNSGADYLERRANLYFILTRTSHLHLIFTELCLSRYCALFYHLAIMSFETKQGMAVYAAPSLFQPHRARQAIRDAHQKKIAPILCYYAGLSSLPITRYLAPMGYDAVWIDWEHTACNVETMTSMVHEAIFMSQGRTMPFVRVPDHSHSAIIWALDAGASVIVPQVRFASKQHSGIRSW